MALLQLLEGCIPASTKEQSIQASLAHTQGAGAAAILQAGLPLRFDGIGIDIEPSLRATSTKLDARVRHQEDPPSLETLDLWTLKEACHKADGLEGDTAFAEYRVGPFESKSHIGIDSPTRRYASRLWEIEGFRVAVALRRHG